MKKIFNLLLSLILLISCNNTGADRELEFREFMKKFKPLDVPLTINVSDFNCNCEALELESSDSLFIEFRNSNAVSYGYLADTTKFYAFIYFYSGDAPYFWISTFDKSYNKIADTSILNQDGYTPATRCLEGSTHIVFNKDFRFETIDTLKYLYCDSLGEEIGLIDSVVFKNVLIKTTLIENDGSIRIKKN